MPGTLNAYREKVLGRAIKRGRNLSQQSFQKLPQTYTQRRAQTVVYILGVYEFT